MRELDTMEKIFIVTREWFDGMPTEVMVACKTEEAAIKWMDDHRPKGRAAKSYQFWYEEVDFHG